MVAESVERRWEGERIRLRRPVTADRHAIFDGWASSRAATRFMAWPTHRTLEHTDAFLALSDDMWEEFGCGPMVIELRQSGEVIGCSGLMMAEGSEVGSGYIINRRFQGQGYATEALALTIEAARERGVNRLVAGIYPGNIASRVVSRRCGFAPASDNPTMLCVFPQIDPEIPQVAVRYVLDLSAKDDSVMKAKDCNGSDGGTV